MCGGWSVVLCFNLLLLKNMRLGHVEEREDLEQGGEVVVSTKYGPRVKIQCLGNG